MPEGGPSMDRQRPVTSDLSRRQFLGRAARVIGAAVAGTNIRVFRHGTEVALAASGVTTITLWTSAGPRFGLANDALIKAFQQKRPDIQVRMVTTPIGDYFPKVAT